MDVGENIAVCVGRKWGLNSIKNDELDRFEYYFLLLSCVRSVRSMIYKLFNFL